jgi:hypothetical protein
MKEFDRDGRLLCELQGAIFERSVTECKTSSAVFARRYMHSEYAARMDQPGFLDRPGNAEDAFEALDEQYGASSYGSEKFSKDEMYWIGYLYRYWAYVYEISSKAVYRESNVTRMHSVYYAYHTLDPLNAIQRLIDANGAPIAGSDDSLSIAVALLRRIRGQSQYS